MNGGRVAARLVFVFHGAEALLGCGNPKSWRHGALGRGMSAEASEKGLYLLVMMTL